MNKEDVYDAVKNDLRARPGSHLSEIYFRLSEMPEPPSSTDVMNALFALNKQGELSNSNGKWSMVDG